MEAGLVERAQRGDREAFSVLAARASGRLHGSARLMLRYPDMADDVVQDTLIEAWRSIRGLRDPERIDAWLHRLLVRSCQRRWRAESRRRLVEVHLPFGEGDAVDDAARSVADRDEMERAFRRLTDDQRVVLTLVYHADLALADVAAVLGIPVGTVKSRLSRAMAALRAALEADARPATMPTGEVA